MLARIRSAVTPRRVVYYSLALIAFVVATFVADVRARVALGGETLNAAIGDHLYWAAVQLVGTILLLAPFAVVAWWADRAEGQGRSTAGRMSFALLIALFVWRYWSAYQMIPGYLAERMWTAATLTIGLQPFYALGISALFLMADWLVRTVTQNRSSR